MSERTHPKQKSDQGAANPTPKRNLVICQWPWPTDPDWSCRSPTQRKIIGRWGSKVKYIKLTLTLGLLRSWPQSSPPTSTKTTTTTTILTILWPVGFAAGKNRGYVYHIKLEENFFGFPLYPPWQKVLLPPLSGQMLPPRLRAAVPPHDARLHAHVWVSKFWPIPQLAERGGSCLSLTTGFTQLKHRWCQSHN